VRGSTRKRGSTWTAYYDLDPDPQTGARRQKSKGGFRTQKDAQRYLATVVTAVSDGTFVEPSSQPLGRYLLDEWLPAIQGTVRTLTAKRYGQVARDVADRDVGAVPLRNLTGDRLNTLYRELEHDGRSAATRRLVHSVLSRALGDAVRWDKLARNPVAAADPPAEPRTRVEAWTARELRMFLEHVADDRLCALWRLGATTGMRRGELAGVTWRVLDLEGGRLRVEQQIVAEPGGATFGPPKTPRSERTIALDPETVEALRAHREAQLLERDVAGPAYVDHDLVFASELGGMIHPGTLTDRFAALRKAAGLSSGSLHVLRHTSVTLALTANPPVPLHVVAGRTGDDPKTLLKTYAHLLPHSDAEAAQLIAAQLVDKSSTNGAAPDRADAEIPANQQV
jgi:integrase